MPPIAELPHQWLGSECVKVVTLSDVPNHDALAQWLLDMGIPVDDWGKKHTKTVANFWDEMNLDESGLEVWKKPDGSLHILRMTHVLRAKVCSPESYARDVFLFNPWQQFSDGRKRTRNGLLSEKLALSELPLENNVHNVCVRAVTQEEMQRISETVMKLQPGEAPPEYDPNYVCPLKVVEEHFIDHTIEVEESKSYPGLLTLYHLYTVDIICSGLPKVDFNTLEFTHPKVGEPKLKYIHAWAWLSWLDIKRHLFEGSELKETKKKGSFPNSLALGTWLTQFDLNFLTWTHTVQDLFDEIENEEAQLELWGRHDGVPLLMRVVHVIQLKVCSTDPRHARRILLETFKQHEDGQIRVTNRLPSKKQSTKHLPFDEDRFKAAAEEIALKTFGHLSDATFKVCPGQEPKASDFEKVDITVMNTRFVEKHMDIQDSPTFPGMNTMYHLYAMAADVGGLPLTNFTSITFRKDPSSTDMSGEKFRCLHNWQWASWEQILDIVHAQTSFLQHCKGEADAVNRRQSRRMKSCVQYSGIMNGILEKVESTLPSVGEDVGEARKLLEKLKQELSETERAANLFRDSQAKNKALPSQLPPSMVSKMSGASLACNSLEEDARKHNIWRAERRLTLTKVTLDQ